MEIFDILALLIILLAFVWPLVQAFFLRRKRAARPVEAERRQVQETYTALYGEEPEEEVIEIAEPEPEPEPMALAEREFTSAIEDPLRFAEWEFTSELEEVDMVSEHYVETDIHYVRDGVGASRVHALLSSLPSKGDMILLHEILSPPKSL